MKAERKIPGLVWLLSALLFFYGFFLGGQQMMLVKIGQWFDISTAAQGALVSAQHITAVVTPPIMGVLADKFGKKPVLVCFAFVFGIGCLMAALSLQIGIYIAAVCLIGAGYSVCETLCSAVCSDISIEHGAQYINMTQCLLSVGAIVSPLLLKALNAPWQLPFALCATAFTILAVWVWTVRFPQAVKAEKTEKAPKKFLFSPLFISLFVGIVIYVGLENGFGYFVEPLFAQKQQASNFGAYGISAYWTGMALSRLYFSLRSYRPGRTLRLCFLSAAATFLLLIFVQSSWVSIVLCALVGFTYGPIWSTLVAGAAEHFPEHRAAAVGAMSSGCGVGGIIYPVLMGLIAEHFNVSIAFVVLSISACIGALISLHIKNLTPQKQKSAK